MLIGYGFICFLGYSCKKYYFGITRTRCSRYCETCWRVYSLKITIHLFEMQLRIQVLSSTFPALECSAEISSGIFISRDIIILPVFIYLDGFLAPHWSSPPSWPECSIRSFVTLSSKFFGNFFDSCCFLPSLVSLNADPVCPV